MSRRNSPSIRASGAGPLRLCWTLAVWLGLFSQVYAQISRDGAARLAVDVVLIRGGQELRGSVVMQETDFLTLAVRRRWLREQEPDYCDKVEAEEKLNSQAARQETLTRIKNWLDQLSQPGPLRDFLLQEQARLAVDRVDDPEPSEFLLLRIQRTAIRRNYIQRLPWRKLAALAWELRLDDVESTPFLRLQELVEEHDPNWMQQTVHLAHRLPRGLPETDEQWRARQAVIEHRLHPEPLEFQGTGDMLIRVSQGQAVDLQSLLSPLFAQSALLKELGLSPPRDGKSSAIAAAEAAGRRSLRITRVTPNPLDAAVSVDSTFLYKSSSGDWIALWEFQKSANLSSVRAGALEQVQADARVQQVIAGAKQLGLDAGLDTALRTGALTLDLQQEISDQWSLFSDPMIQSIDNPPVAISR